MQILMCILIIEQMHKEIASLRGEGEKKRERERGRDREFEMERECVKKRANVSERQTLKDEP